MADRPTGPVCASLLGPGWVDEGTRCVWRSPTSGPTGANQASTPLAGKAPGLTIYVIGSPSKDQKYQYQFVSAASCRPNDRSTIWLVEKTGYQIYGVSLSYIAKEALGAGAGGYGWITPKEPLVGWLNSFKDGSISKLVVFSHGLRGLIALRYGWDKAPDYGLSVADVAGIDPKKFAPNPVIEFDSCNSGVPEASGGLSVAQAVADRVHATVGAWTGRTAYADVNSGASCAVRGSELSWKNPLEVVKELWSRYKAGGAPEFKLFPANEPVPEPRDGGTSPDSSTGGACRSPRPDPIAGVVCDKDDKAPPSTGPRD
jgi:hypothetical protein